MSKALNQFRADNPAYADVPDAELADALHSKYYAEVDKGEYLKQIGLGAPEPTTEAAQQAVDEYQDRTEIPGRAAKATGQALQNVPENIQTGVEGLKLNAAEKDAEVARSDISALDQGAAKLAQANKTLAYLEDLRTTTDDRAQIPEIEKQISRLRQEQGQLELLYGGAAEQASIESGQARQADARAIDAREGMAEASADMVPVDAPPGSPEWYISAAIASSAESAPALLASVIARSPAPMMTFMGAYSKGRAYASGRAEGLTPAEARGYSTLTAIAEGIPEALPVSVMLKPGASFITRVVKGAAAESVQESLTEALQAGIDRGYIQPDMTWAEARVRIKDAGIVGSMAGGVMGGGVDITQRAMGRIAEAMQPAASVSREIADNVIRRLNLPKPTAPKMPTAPQVDSTKPGLVPGDPMADVDQFTQNTLNFIGSLEAPRGYDQIYSGSQIDTPKPLSSMTISEVRAWQDQSVAAGSASSAAGRFQIIRNTMDGLIESLGLTGNEVFDEAMQNRMGVELMREAGLTEFQEGKITAAQFGNRLAGVWAALPQVSGQNAGNSVYAGDGLNGALASVSEFMGVLGGVAFDPSQSSEGGSGFRGGGEQTSPQVTTTADTTGGAATGGAAKPSGSTAEAAPSTPSTLPEVQTPDIQPVGTAQDATTAPQDAPSTPIAQGEDQNAPKTASQAATAVEEAAAVTNPEPTEAQKEAGNYQKGSVSVNGFDISIENARGSERTGIDADGETWSTTMPAHYGYIKRTKGADGDQVDVYIGDNPDSKAVFIVDQVDPATGKFDEHKVIMGVEGVEAATAIYEGGFSDGTGARRMSAIRELTASDFKEWLKSGSQTKPYSKQKPAYAPDAPSGDASFEGMVDMLRASNPGTSDADLAEVARKIIRKVGGRVSKTEAAENPFNALDPQQKIDAVALAQASGMPNKPTKRTPSKVAKKPKAKKRKSSLTGRPSTAKEIELARKTAITKLKEAALEIERKVETGTDTLTEVSIILPSGRTTKFMFMATPAGAERARDVIKQWKKKPAATLAYDPPTAIGEGLHFDMPMPGHQPLWRDFVAPQRSDDTIEVAGESVKLPPQHKPARRATIRLFVEGMIGSRIYQGKIKGRSVAGFYRRNNGEVRLRKFDDIEVLAHELAHWMDFHDTFGGRFTKMRKTASGKAQDQMRALSYTSHPTKVNSEGFAEYVRLWLTQYDIASAKAPDFTKAFEAELRVDPKFHKKMIKLRRDMHIYFQQGALAQARGNIGSDETVGTATRRFMQSRPIERLRQQAIDRLHGIKVAEREVTGGIADADNSPYKLMQMVNGAGSIFDAVVQDGTPVLTVNGIGKRGKSLNEVFEPIYKQGASAFDDFLQYAAGRRAQELTGQGRENLFPPDQIEAMLNLERDGFSDVFEDFQKFNGEMLDFYVQMGLITQDQREAFADMNQSYIPFHRVSEALETGDTKGKSAGLGVRLKGGDRNVRDLADNIADGLMTNIRAAMIARAKQRLYADLTKSNYGAAFAAKIGTDSAKVKMHLDEMAMKIAETMANLGYGISKDGLIIANPTADTMTDTAQIAAVLQKNPELLEFWQHNLPPTTKDTVVDSVVINGKLTYFEVIDPVLAESLMGQEMLELGVLYQFGAGVKNMMTRLITSMPPFMIPNIVRDTVSAGTLSDSGFRPGIDSLRGLGHIVTRSKTYRDWQRNGGGYSSLLQATTRKSGRGRASLAIPQDWRHPMTTLTKTLAMWDAVGAVFENSTRVGEFIRAQEKGMSKTEAAFRAREVSTDFAKRPGNVGWAALLRLTAFMNAALQGNDRLVKGFIGEDGRVDKARLRSVGMATATRMFTKVGATMASFTALLWFLQHDDERYKQLTPDQKSRFWHIFFPWSAGSIQIPKPYGVGFIFADTVENMLDHVFEVDGAQPAKNLAWAAAHHFWFLDYPSIAQPFVDDMKNETFTGAPVVPVYMQDLSPENQYRDTTPEVYKIIGENAGMSPMRLQHYSRGFLGYLETAFSDLTEAMLWDEDQFGARPFPRGVSEYLFKQFQGAPFPYRTKYTEQYYELRQRARTAASDLRKLSGSASKRPDRLNKFAADKMQVTLSDLNAKFATIDRELSTTHDAVDAIKYNPKLSQAEKERRIEKIYSAKNDVLKKVYTAVTKSIDKMEKDAK